jgi:hypothetical protein
LCDLIHLHTFSIPAELRLTMSLLVGYFHECMPWG